MNNYLCLACNRQVRECDRYKHPKNCADRREGNRNRVDGESKSKKKAVRA